MEDKQKFFYPVVITCNLIANFLVSKEKMKLSLLIALIQISLFSNAVTDSVAWQKKEHASFSLYYMDVDKVIIKEIEKDIHNGISQVSVFFGKCFPAKFDVYIFPDRHSMNEQWRKDWDVPDFNSECWMVASGVAKRLDILSPQRWSKEACEHNGNDSIDVQQIITHELTHVYHAQHCANQTFDGMDDYGWLIEGLATYVSGQLTEAKTKSVKEQVATGKAPPTLADFWKGKLRYQQTGSLIKYIDEKYGREKLFALLKLTSLNEMMNTLNTTERELISKWKDSF